MFWSGNFIVVRELNFLLKEENVTLTQVLEADDILQECKADNKALMQFLTRPDILAELITLITEEPPKNVEVAQQYRHASIACEVLTSPLSMLSDRLSLDTAQMNRLCDFINRDPPLNPLLASYFSKTVEMLLERSPKQDWYLYHIVCLRVLDFFKSRRDFLPNLLRHISTSAIADTFKYFIRLDDLFNKFIMEWLEEHQIIECLIQIICGTYVPEEFPATGPEEPEKGQREPSEKEDVNHKDVGDAKEEGSEEQEQEKSVSEAPPGRQGERQGSGVGEGPPALSAEERGVQKARTAAVASANAAALLCELVTSGCAGEGAATRSRTSWVLVSRLQSASGVRALLQGMFTASGAARGHACGHGCKLLLALLNNHVALGAEGSSERCNVELAVAPHLPLLHQALLHDPHHYAQEESGETRRRAREKDGEGEGPGEGERESECVGEARVMTATLVAHLALSEVEEVASTMLTLGTPGVLVEMLFRFENNNFLHAAVLALLTHALRNRPYRTQYARHLLVECDLLTRLMDAFEENENKPSGTPRSGYMGHVTLMLSCISDALEDQQHQHQQQQSSSDNELATLIALQPSVVARFNHFREQKLFPLMQQYDTPLGGSYPSESIYEDSLTDTMVANYDFCYAMAMASATASLDEPGEELTNDNEMGHQEGHADSAEFIAGGLGLDDEDKMNASERNFLELASRKFGADMWDDAPEGECEGEGETETETGEGEGAAGAAPTHALRDVLGEGSPWESSASSGGGGSSGGEGWAQFDTVTGAGAGAGPAAGAGADPFAEEFSAQGFAHYWPYEGDGGGRPSVSSNISAELRALQLEEGTATVSLANNLLTAMSGMTPDAIANIVNANLHPTPIDTCVLPPLPPLPIPMPMPDLPALHTLPTDADESHNVPPAPVSTASPTAMAASPPEAGEAALNSSPRRTPPQSEPSEPTDHLGDVSPSSERDTHPPVALPQNNNKVLEVSAHVTEPSER